MLHCEAGAVSISAAQCLPIAVSVSFGGREVSLFERLVVLYEQVDVVNVDERVSNERGTCLLMTAITVRAHSTAASVASTEVPSDT